MQYLHPYFCGLRERRMVECFSIAVKLPFLALEKTAARPYFLPRKQPGCLFCRVFFSEVLQAPFLDTKQTRVYITWIIGVRGHHFK